MTETELNPLSPWCGEPKCSTLSSPGQPLLELHPSRVVRFLGNPPPDPSAVGGVLIRLGAASALRRRARGGAVARRATSPLHEAKVDVVTVPNLSEHLSSVEATGQPLRPSAARDLTAP